MHANASYQLIGFDCALLIFGTAPAASQQMRDGAAAMHTIRQPFAIETFGIFRNMMLSGDFSPKVQLSAAMAKHPTTGVGAIADARGEITIYDGKLIVSYGKPAAPVDVTADHAALLAMGSAGQWQAVPIERDVAPEDVESYIAATAKARGIDPDSSFPFQISGKLGPYVMHVNAAPIDGPHGMGLPMAGYGRAPRRSNPGSRRRSIRFAGSNGRCHARRRAHALSLGCTGFGIDRTP